jgi:F-type H+-transporting ATPase subunit b
MEKLISEFSSGLFFWQTIIFVTLIFLLRKYAWKPILDTVNEREKSIRDSLNSAKEAKKKKWRICKQRIKKFCKKQGLKVMPW